MRLLFSYNHEAGRFTLFANLDQTAERKTGDVSRPDSLGSGCARGQGGTEGGSRKRMEAEQRPGLSVGVLAATGWPEEAAVGGGGLGRPNGRCRGGRVNRALLGFGRESAHQAQTP